MISHPFSIGFCTGKSHDCRVYVAFANFSNTPRIPNGLSAIAIFANDREVGSQSDKTL